MWLLTKVNPGLNGKKLASSAMLALTAFASSTACKREPPSKWDQLPRLQQAEPVLAPLQFASPISPFNHVHASPRHDSHVTAKRRTMLELIERDGYVVQKLD
jgi:hypothetical protein